MDRETEKGGVGKASVCVQSEAPFLHSLFKAEMLCLYHALQFIVKIRMSEWRVIVVTAKVATLPN